MPFDCPFQTPVILVIAGARHVVRSAREAAWLLAERWPDLGCVTFRKALSACADAMEGRASAARARRALVRAALSAGLPVRS